MARQATTTDVEYYCDEFNCVVFESPCEHCGTTSHKVLA